MGNESGGSQKEAIGFYAMRGKRRANWKIRVIPRLSLRIKKQVDILFTEHMRIKK